MAIKRNKRFHVEVATSALSDIMFFLLLFFLIISTLANPNVIKMDLPSSKNPKPGAEQHLTVSVISDPETSEKKFFIDKEEVPFDQLEQKLIEKTTQKGDKTVVVRIPFDMQVQSLIDVLQIGVENDMKFVIATKAK